jgi:hypothetical protein
MWTFFVALFLKIFTDGFEENSTICKPFFHVLFPPALAGAWNRDQKL